MALLIAKVSIKGVRPLLFHRFTTDTIPLERKERTGVAGNDPEEWKKTYSATPDRQLYLDPSYIFACIREGSKYTKQGKGSIQPKVVSTLQVIDDKILLDRFIPKSIDQLTDDSSQPVYLDIRSVKNPNSKGRNVRYRVAVSSEWKTEFNILWENTMVSREQMKSICNDAGQLTGLADGRSIGFGRFQVMDFEIEEFKNRVG